uniref:Uncharacterized protein n=1 Tax=Sus scrofa TaxID=9823 RepID=A0A8D1A2I7_PIG
MFISSKIHLCAIQGHSEKMAVYNPGEEASPRTKLPSTLILDFLISRTVRNRYIWLKTLRHYKSV